jgi:hypothetical protein
MVAGIGSFTGVAILCPRPLHRGAGHRSTRYRLPTRRKEENEAVTNHRFVAQIVASSEPGGHTRVTIENNYKPWEPGLQRWIREELVVEEQHV